MLGMTRPPPTRPHIGFSTSSRFSSYSSAAVEWADEDAWDSGSDSESAAPKPLYSRKSSSVENAVVQQATPARPVPNRKRTPSTSSLAFSYTHVNAPSPSSYSPQPDPPIQTSPKASWTMVSKPSEAARIKEDEKANDDKRRVSEEFDVDEILLGSMDLEASSSKLGRGSVERDNIRLEAAEIVHDPLHWIRRRHEEASRVKSRTSESPGHIKTASQLMREQSIKTNRRNKFVEFLLAEDINIVELRKMAWNGIPEELRPVAWQLLLGYLPLPAALRSSTLIRKREEYSSLVELSFARGREGLDQQIWHQIEIDVPRTRPGVQLWMNATAQKCIERILYVWAIRHPASGYVQGINDLVTPFFQVFLSSYITTDPELFDPSLLPKNVLNAIEADSFWCLSRLLDGIQDNYIFAQPGIQRSVKRMAELVARIDAPLATHLQAENVEFMQFAFRWMNCLLMREMSVKNTIRMWDTYLAEGPDAFSQFHLYVCSAFLIKWSKKLQEMDFQGIIMFLQSLPTQNWNDHDIELLLSHAFVLNSTWQNAQSHFQA